MQRKGVKKKKKSVRQEERKVTRKKKMASLYKVALHEEEKKKKKLENFLCLDVFQFQKKVEGADEETWRVRQRSR